MIGDNGEFQEKLDASIRDAQRKDSYYVNIRTIIFSLIVTMLLWVGTVSGIIKWKDPRLTPKKTEKPKTEQSRQQTITIKMANSIKTCSPIIFT